MRSAFPIVLSQEQQDVVDFPLRPLRVSAGAGTGKTTTVSYRIARMIKSEGIAPEQVLGLTFTNKATQQLSEKIREVVSGASPDPMGEAQVNTYHGFCSRIVAEFGVVLGIERNPPIIGPAQTRQLVKQVIRETDLPGLDNTDFFHLPGRIIRFCSALSDHLLDPHQLDQETQATALPRLDRSDFRRKGDWNRYQSLLASAPKRRGLLEAARHYQHLKQQLGVVDYGDLIFNAYRLLAAEPPITERITARYRAVVADEYQDTNAAQRVILQKLFGKGFPLTVVGDSDQTLYEWRGASLRNFEDFPTHFPTRQGKPSQTLPLTFNRRSGPEIIRFANRVKQKIGSDTNDLQALPDASASRVHAQWFDTFSEEAVWIAEQLREYRSAGRSWKDMAILFRKTKDIQGVYRQLIAHDIPVDVASLGGLISVPEVVEIHSWLRVVGRFDDRAAAARLLSGSRYRLGLGDIRHLSKLAYQRSDGPPRALLDGLDDPRFWKQLPDRLAPPFRRFHREYRRLLSACQSLSAGEACRLILQETRVWADIKSMPENPSLSARLNLYRFLELAENWSPLEGPSSVAGFLEYVEALIEEPAEEVDTARLSGEDAVTLITVHKAKGLEWPLVFIPAVYRGNFPAQAVGGYDNADRKAEAVPWEWRLDPPDLDPVAPGMDADGLTRALLNREDYVRNSHFSQEWRAAYVAATRAKEELMISGAHWYGYPEPTVRPQLPEKSEFFTAAWAFANGISPTDADDALRTAFPVGQRPESFADPPQAAHAPDPVFSGGWAEGLRSALENPNSTAESARMDKSEEEYQSALQEFQGMLLQLPDPDPPSPRATTTSATGLVTYAQCPKKYFWTAVDPLPRRYSYVTRRGTRIHRQIELHHQGKVPLLEPDEEAPDLTGDDRPVDSSGPGPFEVFLRSRFSDLEAQWLEKAFTLRLREDFLVRGRIDAVYRHDSRTWEIVDFKSGRPPSEDPHGARLAQMQVYAVALRETPELGPPPDQLSVTIAYLGGGELAESPAAQPVDQTWLASARTRLEGLAGAIADEKWTPTPSDECRKCDFYHLCPEGKTFIGSIGRKS